MFAVKRYSNPQGESLFVPSFNGQPSKEVPDGFTEVAGPEEASNKVLQRAGLGSPTSREDILRRGGIDPNEGSAAVLRRAGLAPEKQSDAFAQQQKSLEQKTTVQDQTSNLLDKQQKELKEYFKSTEAPETVTSKSIDHLTTQLKSQYAAIQNGSGYKYQNEKELDLIFSAQAAKLAVNGINDLRDVGYEDVTIEPTTKTIKNVQEKDGKYYYTDYDSSDSGDRVEISADKIKDIREVEEDMGGGDTAKRLEAEVIEGGGTERYLINKVTGKRLNYIKFTSGQWRDDLASKGEFAGSLGKSKGELPLQDRGGFSRWGHQLDVEGMADYAAEFVDGNFVTMPVWKDTKTDLTPLMMIASIALAAYGVPAQIGGALTTTGTTVGTQLAVGNAVIAGGMTALSGGDLEDIAKSAVLSGGMTYASAYVPAISKTIGETLLGPGAPGSLTVGTAITNAGINGIAAALMGQDVGKAMLAGSVQGAVQVNASDFLKSTFGNETFKNLSETLNIKPEDMEKVVIRSLSKGAGAMAYNKNFFTTFRDSLISEGLSLSAANTATKAMAKNPNLSQDTLVRVHRTVRAVSQVAITAKQRGLNPENVLESVYLKIIVDMAKPVKK